MKLSPLVTHMSLVAAAPAANAPALFCSDRKRFWHGFIEWLSFASDEETEMMERVLAEYAHHVRPLVDVVSDALRHRDSAIRLPTTLLATLVAHGWQPCSAQTFAQAA